MSEYANQLNIKIAEVVRLTFSDVVRVDETTEEVKDSIEIVVHLEFFKNMYQMMSAIIKEDQENLVKQAELNRKMN